MNNVTFRGVRQVAQLSQHAFAEHIGVHKNTVAFIEAGYKPVPVDVAEKVIAKYGAAHVVKVAELFGQDYKGSSD